MSGHNQRLDKSVTEKLHSLASEGVRNVTEIKRAMSNYVDTELLPGQSIPKSNRRFNPTNKDIRNHLFLADVKIR